jgi:CRISPR-associated protein Csd1
MSWIQKLYETYQNCQVEIGKATLDNQVPLLPICHTTQKAQLEIVIDDEGNYLRAHVISKENARTIIPCTEESSGRTSGERAHPLCDKLQYIASDYKKYGGEKKTYHKSYIRQLEDWCNSEFADPSAIAVLTYVKKGTMIGDLVNGKVLFTDEHTGMLLTHWEKKTGEITPKIFEVAASQDEAFVRWVVAKNGQPDIEVWRDHQVWQNWINYYTSQKMYKSLCYVTGEILFSADQHPAKIRNDGDKAKIISSNDSSGFTYRGRFTSSDQVASVGFEVTQKAHYALRWLISRQGYRRGDQAIVAWATSGDDIPNPTDDPLEALGISSLQSDSPETAWTAEYTAVALRNKIAGYQAVINSTKNIVVMGLDSATPGRMSITYYRELTGSDFLARIEDWHKSCAWVHTYRAVEVIDSSNGKKKKRYFPFIGAPSPGDIAEAAYGQRVDDNLRKTTVERILPCIIDGQPIPRDLVESTVRRASNRISMEYWEWNKTLTIACALFRKYNRKEEYDMALDLNRKTRDYLYGRLLALAESLEEWALNSANENRETNAARLMQRFAEHPFSTWRTIELSLAPYKAKLGGASSKRQGMIDDVIASFNEGDFISDKPLSGEFLLGYHCQREALHNRVDKTSVIDDQK